MKNINPFCVSGTKNTSCLRKLLFSKKNILFLYLILLGELTLANNTSTDTIVPCTLSEYVTWSNYVVDCGPGKFTLQTGLSDFFWLLSGDYHDVSVQNYHYIQDNVPNGFETLYGEADNASHLYFSTQANAGLVGDTISKTSNLTLYFSAATPVSGWSLGIIDLEKDQVRITARDLYGNLVPTSVINTWVSGTFDADPNPSRNVPYWDNVEGAFIGHESPTGTWHHTIPDDSGFYQDEAAGAWLSPNIPITSITLEMQVFAANTTASIHVYVASCQYEVLAEPDYATTNMNTSTLIEVLDNDSPSIGLDPLSLSVVTPPANGVAQANPAGNFNYIPSNNYTGADSFVYQICDYTSPNVICDTTTVFIDIADSGPCLSSSIISFDEVCANEGLLVQAGNAGVGAIYYWDFGSNATPANSSNISETVEFSTLGIHTIKLTVTKDNCKEEILKDITVETILTADAGEDVEVCLGEPIEIGGKPSGPAGSDYLWQPAAGLDDPTAANPSASPLQSTQYTLFVTNGNCTSTSYVNVTVDVLSMPYIYAGMDQFICEGETVVLGGDNTNPTGPDGAVFSWTPTTGLDFPTAANPTASPSVTTTYTVIGTRDGCSMSDEVLVEVLSIAAVDAGEDKTRCLGAAAVPIGSVNNDPFAIFQWSPTDGVADPISAQTTVSPAQTTLYTLTSSRFGCYETDEVLVRVQDCNLAPVAEADSIVLYVNESVSSNLLQNDMDADGDNIVVSELEGTNPSFGTVLRLSNGDFTYTPQVDFVGFDSFMYVMCDDAIIPACDSAIVFVEVLPEPCLGIQLKVFMEGSLAVSNTANYNNSMRSTLNTSRGILPGQTPVNPLLTPTPAGQPYSIAPWNYLGQEGIGWNDENYEHIADEHGLPVVDWVLVSIVEATGPPTKLLRAAGLVLEDGRVVFLDDCFEPVNGSGAYYLMIEHRNHIGVMTPYPMSVENGLLQFDFTKEESYLDSPVNPTGFGQKEVVPEVFAMFAADGAQTGDTPSYDINGLDKILWSTQNGLFDQYLPTDYDMDGDVNGFDKVMWSRNNGISSRAPR